MPLTDLHFIKLGGSLITDKHLPGTARPETIRRIAAQIAEARRSQPDRAWVIGHGSGSFGHVPAKKYGTRLGVSSPEDWLGFAEVWQQAALLNRIVLEALAEAGLPAIRFSPSSAAITEKGALKNWDLRPLKFALENGLMPVVHGDVTFDNAIGGSIVSTEEIFAFLARALFPKGILIAGIEPGVWADYPARTRMLSHIQPASYPELRQMLAGSEATDVTGGMVSKVESMLDLVRSVPGLQIRIFDGAQETHIFQAMQDAPLGTLIEADSE